MEHPRCRGHDAPLKTLGVRLAMDDFGPATRRRVAEALPVECVKIDRSFVNDIPGDPATRR